MKNFLYIFLSFMTISLYGQASIVERSISGSITEKNGEVVAGANVLVQSADGKKLFSYSSSDGEGRYEVSFRSDVDSVRVTVT